MLPCVEGGVSKAPYRCDRNSLWPSRIWGNFATVEIDVHELSIFRLKKYQTIESFNVENYKGKTLGNMRHAPRRPRRWIRCFRSARQCRGQYSGRCIDKTLSGLCM